MRVSCRGELICGIPGISGASEADPDPMGSPANSDSYASFAIGIGIVGEPERRARPDASERTGRAVAAAPFWPRINDA